jgi:class 3 adenylate cyclase
MAAGLYDPAAAGADGRLALLRWMDERGVSLHEMVEAADRRQLTSLVSDLAMRPGPRVSVAQAAPLVGLSLAEVVDLRRACGFAVSSPDDPALTESDVEVLRLFGVAGRLFSTDELLHLARVMGSAMRRVAEAAGEMFLRDVEAPLHAPDGNYVELEMAQASLGAIDLAHAATSAFGPLFLGHLEQATLTMRRAREGSIDYSTVPLSVGFVDLSGFTGRSSAATPRELLHLVVTFEATAVDLVTEHGGRLIKLIGDEVMYTAVEPAEACRIARGLVSAAGSWAAGARAGVAHGPVITSGGDVYGETVNLAARMVDIAVPGEVLVTGSVVAAAPDERVEPAGRRLLKGFAEPLRLWSLVADD